MAKKRKKRSGGAVLLIIAIITVSFVLLQLGFIEPEMFDEVVETVLEEEMAGGEVLPDVTPTPLVANLPPAAPEEWIQIHFTNPQFPDEPETRDNGMVDAFVAVLDSAQSSLDVAAFELDLPAIGEALLAAHERGVAVRLVTDSEELEVSEVLIELEEAGLPVVGDERTALMHNKFAVVDGQAVWTGSWNFTHNGSYRNNNHAVYIFSPELAQNYTTEFEEMFIDRQFGPTSPLNTPHPRIIIDQTLLETCFASERDCATVLADMTQQAQQSIRFMAFSFTHDGIGQAVRERGQAGVQVAGIFETRGSEQDYSEYGMLRRQEFGVYQDGNPYTMHHKVFIFDDETVALGSFNFSDNATESNDENMLVIHNPEVARQFLLEFERAMTLAQAAAE